MATPEDQELKPFLKLRIEVSTLDGRRLASNEVEMPWHGATFLVPPTLADGLMAVAAKRAREAMRDALHRYNDHA